MRRCFTSRPKPKAESEPVTDDEFVFRAIPNVRNYYDPSLPQPVVRVAFEPNSQDTDGLSVFREACGVTAAEVAMALPRKGDYYVARLSVAALATKKLTVQAKPLCDQPKGHAVIPELNLATFQANKPKSKVLQRALAVLAGNCIVYKPPSKTS